MPRRDVETFPVEAKLTGPGPDFPDLNELDVIRHYTRLSTLNFDIDRGMYPLGSCTMMHNRSDCVDEVSHSFNHCIFGIVNSHIHRELLNSALSHKKGRTLDDFTVTNTEGIT